MRSVRVLICGILFILVGCGGDSNKEQPSEESIEPSTQEILSDAASFAIDISGFIDVKIEGDTNEIHVFSSSKFNVLRLEGSNNLLYIYDSESINMLVVSGDDNSIVLEGTLDIVSTVSGLGNTVRLSNELTLSEEGVRVTMDRNGRVFDSDIDLPGL